MRNVNIKFSIVIFVVSLMSAGLAFAAFRHAMPERCIVIDHGHPQTLLARESYFNGETARAFELGERGMSVEEVRNAMAYGKPWADEREDRDGWGEG